jgi:hypothetical protein
MKNVDRFSNDAINKVVKSKLIGLLKIIRFLKEIQSSGWELKRQLNEIKHPHFPLSWILIIPQMNSVEIGKGKITEMKRITKAK